MPHPPHVRVGAVSAPAQPSRERAPLRTEHEGQIQMKKHLRLSIAAVALGGALALAGCANDQETADSSPPAEHGEHGGGHGDMEHPEDGGPVPEGMVEAVDPTYPVG